MTLQPKMQQKRDGAQETGRLDATDRTDSFSGMRGKKGRMCTMADRTCEMPTPQPRHWGPQMEAEGEDGFGEPL